MPVRASRELHKRLKIASAEDGVTYAILLWNLLDMRDDRIARQQRAMASPLHPPRDVEAV